ncbi:MAG TPA: hypothetical protein VFF44_08955 [Casimicrobiaceae bacterium]|nr:hypothetical protein [Casimicrobiaceae bacterium]
MSRIVSTLLLASVVALAGCANTPHSMSAAAARRDADYTNAIRNCDTLGSAERATCIEDAKARYGRS